MPRLAYAAAGAAALVATGCTSTSPEEFAGEQPRLVLEEFLAGESRAYGLFEDRFGKLRRQFLVDITGTWDEETKTLTLDERFQYKDGEKQTRIWTIKRTGEHDYEGTADDVIGTAKGQAYGNAFNWRYNLDLKVGDGTWRVRFNDWLYQMDDKVLMNRASVTRFGIEIGTVTLAFIREPETG